MVMCEATDADAEPRKIKDFGEHDIFVGGDLVETPGDFRFPPRTSEKARLLAKDGATWIQVAGRKPMIGVAT